MMPTTEYPTNFRYQSSDQTLHWDGVEDAEEYEIESTPDGEENWVIEYQGGVATSCPFNKPSGEYKTRGKAKKSGEWGPEAPPKKITVS